MTRQSHFKGFPIKALEVLRCPVDGGELYSVTSDPFITSGEVCCRACSNKLPISNGILNLMCFDGFGSESRHELGVREQEWKLLGRSEVTEDDLSEMLPHIEALNPRSDCTLLEFGCGTGRYTFPLAKRYGLLVAVDFSQVALESIAEGGPGDNVALVRADLEHFAVAPQSFDGILSTLTSNLPTAERRRRLYQLSSGALKSNGTFVSGLHYYGLRARLKGVAREGYYNEGGIYRRYMTCDEARSEMGPFFDELQMQPVSILLGVARRLRVSPLRVSRMLERVPVVRETGNFLMTVGRKKSLNRLPRPEGH